MNLAAALKAVAPAVGDGKIVPQHAYVDVEDPDMRGATVRAGNGEMSVEAHVDETTPNFCVRYDALVRALEREGTTLSKTADNNSLIVRAGRSRVTLRCLADGTFPTGMTFTSDGGRYGPGPDFQQTLTDLSKFTAGGDGHIWQMGVHFRSAFVFAFGPFAATFKEQSFPHDLTIPPWAIRFILAQDGPPTLCNGTNTFRAEWDGLTMISTRLIEEAPDGAHTFIENLPREGGVPVPDNLKETVERIKSYGVKRFRLGNGKIDHQSEQLEIEEEIDLDVAPRIWGVEQMLAALEFAETIDLSGERAIWHGGGYHGVFSGLSG